MADDPMLVRLQLMHQRLQNLLDRVTTASTFTEDELTKQVNLIEDCSSKFTAEIHFYMEKSSQTSPDLLKLFTETQFKAEEWKAEMKALLKSSTHHYTSEAFTNTAKLPKLSLPKFKGEVLRWSEFWDRFRTNIDERPLPEAEKMAYLVGCLEDEALRSVEGLSITHLNYKVAVEILKDRYGNEQNVVDAHYEAINNLQRAGNNVEECRSTLNVIERHLRVLKALGEVINGNHLRSTILSKFPEKVVYELHLLSSVNEIDSIRSGLQRIITAMEMSKGDSASTMLPSNPPQAISTGALHISNRQILPNQRKERSHQNMPVRKNLRASKRKPTENIEIKSKNKKPRMSCIFCQGVHYNASCTVVKGISERKKKLGRRCYLCFREGHKTISCAYKKLCYFCKGKHNQALCPQNKTGTDISMISCLTSDNDDDTDPQSYLQTAIVTVGWQNSNNTKRCRVLLDSGSQRSYITTHLAKELKLPSEREDLLMVFVFGADSPVEILSPSTEIKIETMRGIKRNIQVNIVPYITDKILPPKKIDGVDVVADDGSTGDSIQLLIGNDYYFSFFKNEIKCLKDNLYLINTDFGWMITGKIVKENNDNILSVITYCRCQESASPYFVTPDLPFREPDIKFIWALESIGITDSPKVTREEEAVKHFNETVKYEDRRYQVKWPWIVYPPVLPDNYGLAYGRLSSLVRRLQQDAMDEYDGILKEQLAAGVIEIIDSTEINIDTQPVHYLPHHIIIQKGKRGRIVYDASAKLRDNKSLNECMYRGPSMLEDLTALLLKFRISKIGITADVEKAFLQVGLQREDRDVTRFLWLKDIKKGVTEENILHLRFCRVPFGIIASPFLLTATIRHHLSQGDDNLMSEIAERTYVDNLVTGSDTLDKARDLINKTRTVFTELSMNIREWTSNNKQLMKSIPKQYRGKDTESTKVLGLTWDLAKDTLKLRLNDTSFDTKKGEETPSKREILRVLASLYDPCGFAAPLVLPTKLLLQELWKRKLKWDTPLPVDLKEEWENALSALKTAREIEVPRYVGDSLNKETECELHCFTDASKRAFSAVVYLRILNKRENKPKVVFIMAKSRVTPINHKEDLKIPKLELLGFVIGRRLLTYVKDSLGLQFKRLCLWSDSEIVLYWMKSEKLLPPFVSRRINEIKQNKDIEPRYVNTELNPADLATRPELWDLKKELWSNGPQFLLLSEEGWPSLQEHGQAALFTSLDPETNNREIDALTQMEELPTESIEMTTTEGLTIDLDKPEGIEQNKDENNNLMEIIKNLQKSHFPDETSGKQTSLSRNLRLFMDMEGILRCKGRLMNTMCSYDTKYPILIPKNSQFTDKLIKETHEKYYHVGTPHTLSIIRQKYWIPQGRAKVQKILRKCNQCIKHGGGPYKLPPTPALPAERANYSAPFTYTGIDYFGPIFINDNGELKKRWICLYTCLAVRAVHMESVRDLTAEECLLALRRFISTRGRPEMIVSDNATQFKLTAELLSQTYFMDNKIRWKFIPQLSPWHGGFYERLVGIVKNCLKRTLEKQILNDTQLDTVIKEIEAVANSRPLTSVGSDIEYVLRPADFLTYGKCIAVGPSLESHYPGGSVIKENLIEGWKKGQCILEEFKRMFIGQYLCSLRERYQHSHKEPRVRARQSPHMGDIVQIKGDSKNRENWKVGRITNLVRGADGECRVARVKVDGKEFIRSVGHLYPLEMEDTARQSSEMPETKNSSPYRRSPSPGTEQLNTEEESVEQVEGETTIQNKDLTEDREPGEFRTPTPEERVNDHGEYTDSRPMVEDTEVVGGEETVASENPERIKRIAAVRAREKIALWTSQLIAILLKSFRRRECREERDPLVKPKKETWQQTA